MNKSLRKIFELTGGKKVFRTEEFVRKSTHPNAGKYQIAQEQYLIQVYKLKHINILWLTIQRLYLDLYLFLKGDITIIGGGGQEICDDSAKALIVKSVTMGEGSKIVYNFVKSFICEYFL